MRKYVFALTLLVLASSVALSNSSLASFMQAPLTENNRGISMRGHNGMAKNGERVFCTKGEIVEVDGEGIVIKGVGTYPLVKVMVNNTQQKRYVPSAEMTGNNRHNLGVRVDLQENNINKGTLIVDGATGRPLNSKKLQIGKKVTAYYNGNATRSYPPQVQGEAVVLITKEDKEAHYYVVDSVEMSANRRYVTVTDTNNELVATIPGKACANYRNIKNGTKLLLWYDLMTMSLPAQTNATKARIIE